MSFLTNIFGRNNKKIERKSRTELEALLKERLRVKAREAFLETFPVSQRNALQIQAADVFATKLSEYSKDEIELMQDVIISTIGIRFDLAQYVGEHPPTNSDTNVRGYTKSERYKDTLSEDLNEEPTSQFGFNNDTNTNNNNRIIGKLDLFIKS